MIDWFAVFNQSETVYELRFNRFRLTTDKSFEHVDVNYQNSLFDAYNKRFVALKQKRRTSMTSGANRVIVAR